jgi:hypothetical protein
MDDDFDTSNFRLRVCADDGNGIRETRFDDLRDAKRYAESCIDATCVEFLHDDNVWRVLWQDGEMVYTRPGFAVLIPYRGKVWNETIAAMKSNPTKE